MVRPMDKDGDPSWQIGYWREVFIHVNLLLSFRLTFG